MLSARRVPRDLHTIVLGPLETVRGAVLETVLETVRGAVLETVLEAVRGAVRRM